MSKFYNEYVVIACSWVNICHPKSYKAGSLQAQLETDLHSEAYFVGFRPGMEFFRTIKQNVSGQLVKDCK